MPHRETSTQVLVVPPRNRVVRYHTDLVGNDLTATLMWCDQHQEPVWVYKDGSCTCFHSVHLEGWDSKDHLIVPPPWEATDG